MNADRSRWTTLIPVSAGLLLYAVLLYVSLSDGVQPLVAVLVAPVGYFTAMYLYYGLTWAAFGRMQGPLWGVAGGAVVLTVLLLGGSQALTVMAGWSMILVTAILAGRLTDAGYRSRTIYVAAVGSLVVFGCAYYLPLWVEMLARMPENVETLSGEVKRQLAAAGESEERSRLLLEAFRRFATVVFRLAPAAMLLSAVVQFSVGYLLFVRLVDRFGRVRAQYEPFHFWRMPYGFIPVVAVVAAIRLAGNEAIQIGADNTLAFLAVFYLVTGLALVEYYLRKIQFSMFMKVLFYVFLALLPLVYPAAGIGLSGVIVLLGFADSFADWRRVRLRELS